MRLGSCLKAANPLRVNVTFIAIKYFSLSVRHLVPITYSIGYLSSPGILHTKQRAHKNLTDVLWYTFALCNSYFTFTDNPSITNLLLTDIQVMVIFHPYFEDLTAYR